MSDLLNNDFKTTVLKVLKELKGDMHKDKKIYILYKQNRNINN